MDADEIRAKNHLEKLGFRVERFTKAETRVKKTPDFRVFAEDRFLFFCEVKSSPPDLWLDVQLEGAASGEIVGGVRNDSIFNRLTSDVYTAAQQFDSVNQRQQYPNVLVLVNHDDNAGFGDLLSVLTGNFFSDSGSIHPIYKKYSEGRIKKEKAKIHLYVWLNDNESDHKFFQILT